jgi:hypothetical protein
VQHYFLKYGGLPTEAFSTTVALAKVDGLATRGDVATGHPLQVHPPTNPTHGVYPERGLGRLFATIPGRGPIHLIRTS